MRFTALTLACAGCRIPPTVEVTWPMWNNSTGAHTDFLAEVSVEVDDVSELAHHVYSTCKASVEAGRASVGVLLLPGASAEEIPRRVSCRLVGERYVVRVRPVPMEEPGAVARDRASAAPALLIRDEEDVRYLMNTYRSDQAAPWLADRLDQGSASDHARMWAYALSTLAERPPDFIARVDDWYRAHPDVPDRGAVWAMVHSLEPWPWAQLLHHPGPWCSELDGYVDPDEAGDDQRARYRLLRASAKGRAACGIAAEPAPTLQQLALSGAGGPLELVLADAADGDLGVATVDIVHAALDEDRLYALRLMASLAHPGSVSGAAATAIADALLRRARELETSHRPAELWSAYLVLEAAQADGEGDAVLERLVTLDPGNTEAQFESLVSEGAHSLEPRGGGL